MNGERFDAPVHVARTNGEPWRTGAGGGIAGHVVDRLSLLFDQLPLLSQATLPDAQQLRVVRRTNPVEPALAPLQATFAVRVVDSVALFLAGDLLVSRHVCSPARG